MSKLPKAKLPRTQFVKSVSSLSQRQYVNTQDALFNEWNLDRACRLGLATFDKSNYIITINDSNSLYGPDVNGVYYFYYQGVRLGKFEAYDPFTTHELSKRYEPPKTKKASQVGKLMFGSGIVIFVLALIMDVEGISVLGFVLVFFSFQFIFTKD